MHLRILLAAATVFATAVGAAPSTVVETPSLRVELDPHTGAFSVLDKAAGVRWGSLVPSQRQAAKTADLLRIAKARAPIVVDGDLADWPRTTPIRVTADMTADAKTVSGNRDLSAAVHVLWDAQYVYLAARVTDDHRVFRNTASRRPEVLTWWERDSVELWVGGTQVGLVLHPTLSLAARVGRKLDGCSVVVKEASAGYVVEAALPRKHFPSLAKEAKVGQRVAFAVGVNDADAAGKREGQIYFPRGWRHSHTETFAPAILADANGTVPAALLGKALDAPPSVRKLRSIARPDRGWTFEADLDIGRGRKLPATVTVTVPDGGRDVCVAIAAANDTETGSAAYPAPLVPDRGESWMAVAPYANGLLLQLRRDKLPRTWWGSDMPFFGITNIETGWGYDCIFETPDDVRMTLRPASSDKDAKMTVGVTWVPSMRKWGYTRKLRYRFCPTGGYVALAKAYRAYAKATGVLKTLREKMRRRPDVAKLLGAPDVWGGNATFCREAKAAGIDRMVINGSFGIEGTEAVKKLGYLASVYDNYEDIMAGKPGRYGDCKIPDDAPLMANGKRMLGWPVHVRDPKTGRTQIDPKTKRPVVKEQFYKRCSALDLPVAKRWIPTDQAKHPRNSRFLDVTTATGLRECFDPKHYCTRTIDRQHRQSLAAYVGDELGLVLGGEHGRWWGVPYFDYWEGMMSGGFYSWPAGHVGMDLPATRDEIGQKYLDYGLGHIHRIPFWELVFGDCVVSYWYWGDSTGHLYAAAPEIATKKDLLNMLYGTLPLYWVSQPYSFKWSVPELRERLLDSYRVTCKLHEQIGFDEMLSHEWLTPDRAVQRTTFSSGTFVVANFADKPYALQDGGTTWMLAPLGFYARGPSVLQYRVRQGERDVTFIKTPDYLHADPGGARHDFGAVAAASPVTLRVAEPDRLRLTLGRRSESVLLRPAQLVPGWDVGSTHLFALGERGNRLREMPLDIDGAHAIGTGGSGVYEMVCGPKHDLPDLSLASTDIAIEPASPVQGQKLTVSVTVHNRGRRRVRRALIALYLGSKAEANRIGTQRVSIAGGQAGVVRFEVATAHLDGPRTLIVVADPENRVPELMERDNVGEKAVTIAPDLSRWRYRLKAEIANGKAEQQDVPVAVAVDFGKELARLGGAGTLDVASIRVCERRSDGSAGQSLLCQFDGAGDFDATSKPKGDVVWIVPGALVAGAKRQFWILFDVSGQAPKRGFAGRVWDAASTTASTQGYTAVLRDGCIVGLYDKLGEVRDKSLLKGLIYSSKETGWTREEESKVLGIDVLANGPVRAVVRVRKKLRDDLTYAKTYTFYPRRFGLHFEADKAYGIISRAYYGLEGTYEESAGNRAKVDGSGDAEGVGGRCPNPKWYVVYAPGWAHSCVALSRFTNITYWDSSSWGGIGFSGGGRADVRMSYVLHPGQKDGTFGQRDHARLTNPPTARLVR